ncbi:MAG: MFS transporter [Chloroflexi bacterium]|nr:MFS transporter [Chloroflexota bacterium]
MTTKPKQNKFYGWWLLFFLWVAYTIPVGFAFYSMPVLFPFIIEETGWSRGQVVMGFTLVLVVMGLTSPVTGGMLRRFGSRVTMFLGGIIAAAAALFMGFVGQVYTLYVALAILLGLGVSFASVLPVQTVVVSWFNIRRALALGLVLGGGAIGGFLAPRFINWAILGAGGDWRIGWFIIAAASVAGALVAILAVRNQPETMGQHPDGLKPEAAKAMTSGDGGKARTHRTTFNWTVSDALKTPALWFLMVAVATTFFTWQVIITQAPLHLQDRGFDPGTAAFLYSLAIGLSVMGRFAIAGLGDIIEPRYLFAFGAFCITLGGVLFWLVSPDVMWIAYLYPLMAGFGFGLCYVCIPTLIGNYWGPYAFAAISGLGAPISMISQALAGPVAGFLYDLQGSYLTVMIMAWVGGAIGFVAMLLCRPPAPSAAGNRREVTGDK